MTLMDLMRLVIWLEHKVEQSSGDKAAAYNKVLIKINKITKGII